MLKKVFTCIPLLVVTPNLEIDPNWVPALSLVSVYSSKAVSKSKDMFAETGTLSEWVSEWMGEWVSK